MKSKNSLWLGIIGLAMFCACTDDKDFYDPEYAKKAYAANWTKVFGEIDPQQDWNMATQVKAQIDLSAYNNDATVKIYTGNPMTEGSKLLGQVSQTTTLDLDVVGSTQYVFATIESNGLLVFNSYVEVKNGMTKVGGSTSATRAASDVSLGDSYVIEGQTSRDLILDPTYTLEEARKVGDTHHWVKVYDSDGNPIMESDNCYRLVNINGVTFHDYFPNHANGYYANQWNYPGQYNMDESSDVYPRRMNSTGTQKYQKLTGVETSRNVSWKVEDYYALFGKNGYFGERNDPSNKSRYKDQFEPDVTFTVTGEVTLDYMFGGTQNKNVFGYYYWKDGEDPIAATRYVLIADAQPSSNLTYSTPDKEIPGTYNDQGAVDDMALADNWMATYDVSTGSYGQNEYAREHKDNIITGTSYKVPYFDANGNASYDFPEGTHIAFFLVVGGLNEPMSSWLTNTNMSVQAHNKSIGRKIPNTEEGEIDAIAFKYGNQVFLGFEDRGGDDDMNDIVFFVNGAKPDDEDIPVVGPPTPTPQPQSWIIACEDLGALDDFDFNDVVFMVSHVSGQTTATVTPLAAGGTLPVYITYNNNVITNSSGNTEVHTFFGIASTVIMINTTVWGREGTPITITVPDNYTMTNEMGGFGLQVLRNGEIMEAIKHPERGEAPQMILVPANWKWPTERTRIDTAYPNFGVWGQNYNNNTWHQTHVEGTVINWSLHN